MINAEELAICRKRGHQLPHIYEDWMECPACHLWVREVRTVTIEEREDAPPMDERSIRDRTKLLAHTSLKKLREQQE